MILSVDLASRRYQDNGIALLSGHIGSVHVETVAPKALGLVGEPSVERFADVLHLLAEANGARAMLLDGPQAWRASQSPNDHARVCERATLTPGKTGLPGVVKPASWTRMATFSVELFDALDVRGWPRLGDVWNGERVAIESFPTRAWRSLGHPSLPGKKRTTDLRAWQSWLEREYIGGALGEPTHDELQAIVAGLAGLQLLDGGIDACERCGVAPHREDGVWREGFIVSPRPRTPRAVHAEPLFGRLAGWVTYEGDLIAPIDDAST